MLCYSITESQCELISDLSCHEDVGFEIRLDTFSHEPDATAIRRMTDRPLLATFRTRPHLGQAETTARAEGYAWRIACLRAGFEWVDLELDEPGLNQKIAEIHDAGGRVVLSHHELGDNQGLQPAFEQAMTHDADVIKIIGSGREPADFARQRDRYRTAGGRGLVHFYMGGDYAASRVLSLIYGAPFTFITPEPEQAVAPGQLSYQDISRFCVNEVELDAMKLFSVIGSPIGHSKSPAFHNPPLKAEDRNALFLALPASNARDLELLLETFPEFMGSAVTKPMKEIAYARADDFLDPNSAELGAVNTLIRHGDTLKATNTDMLAMIELLKQSETEGTVRLLGYGGLGKAVVRACIALNRNVEVCNRNPDRLKGLDPRAIAVPWEDRHREGATIFVQATSAGMAPNEDVSPLDRLPDSARHLIETIYNPLETRLMAMARTQGVTVIDGMALFNEQARIQNRYFREALTH